MKIFLASIETVFKYVDITSHNHYLASYFYLNNQKLLEEIREHFESNPRIELFLDSGAFSAWRRNLELSVIDYTNFVATNEDFFWEYINLDVKPNINISFESSIKQTAENQKYMEESGLKPIPVYHLNTRNYKVLEGLLEKYDFVCLGAIADLPRVEMLAEIDKIFLINQKYKKKIHGLGQTSFYVLSRYPWYTVDSSTWLQGSRTHSVLYLKDYFEMKSVDLEKNSFENFLIPYDCYDREGYYGYAARINRNIKIFNRYENIVKELWEERGFQWKE
jgi:hypothetical protein